MWEADPGGESQGIERGGEGEHLQPLIMGSSRAPRSQGARGGGGAGVQAEVWRIYTWWRGERGDRTP